MSENRKAAIYLEISGDRASPEELDKLTALTAFARAQGWELTGALIERFTHYPSEAHKQLIADWRSSEIAALIVWDDELGYPGVFEDEWPGYPDVRDIDALLALPDSTKTI
ncbi:hypothetical protein ACWEVY_28725 [Streptomyces longwoodensis]